MKCKIEHLNEIRRTAALVLAVLLFSAIALAAKLRLEQRALASQLIRLHVVANSDDPGDQARKLKVRDAVLPVIARLTANCSNAEQAQAALHSGLPEIRAAAESALSCEGCADPISARLQSETFPQRDYPTFSLPAGEYTALRVTIGAGAGHNWWCVAFPALCLPAGVEDFEDTARTAGFSRRQVELMTEHTAPIRVKFRLLEWIAGLL